MDTQSKACNCALTRAVMLLSGFLFLIAMPTSAQVNREIAGFSSGIWQPHTSYHQAKLTVTGPNGFVYQEVFSGSQTISILGTNMPDGQYTYELRLLTHPPSPSAFDPRSVTDDTLDENGRPRHMSSVQRETSMRIQSGYFRVSNGSIFTPSQVAEEQ